MLRKSRNIDTGLELGGTKVCVQGNTTTQLNLGDYFRANNMKFEEVKSDKIDDCCVIYDSGQCDVLTADVSQLYALRLKLSKPTSMSFCRTSSRKSRWRRSCARRMTTG